MNILLFIENKKTINYIIKDELQILNDKIKYRFELVVSKYYNKRVKYVLGENEYELNIKNPFIQNNENIKDKNLSISSIEGDIYIFLFIGLNNNDIKYYSNILKKELLEKKYNVFTYSDNQLNSSNFSSIYIINQGNIKKNICFSYLYNNIEYIFPKNNINCFEIKENEFFAIPFDNPKIGQNNKNEQFFYVVYFDDTLNLICDYSYFTYNEIYNNQLNIISFSSDEKYKILYFNYENKI